MSIVIILLISTAISLLGTLIASLILGLVDDDATPEAVTGTDYPDTASTSTSETTER